MKVRNYHLGNCGLRVLLISDLHNSPYEKIIGCAKSLSPDLIAIAGDLTLSFKAYDRVAGFLEACKDIHDASGHPAPIFLSLGNHDSLTDKDFARVLAESGATLLDDTFVDISIQGIPLRIGGLTSPTTYDATCKNPPGCKTESKLQERLGKHRPPNTDWLSDFCATEACKILLCHQPEFYPRHLSDRSIDLILSGHAHGGQWQIPFTQQGVFAPGQGLFPKLTGGVTDGRLVISRGVSNTTWIPRLFNPREIVVVEI